MSGKRQITPAQMRAELKEMGYTVRIKRNSDFSSAVVTKGGDTVTGPNIITPEFLDKHQAFYDWKNGVSVVEDGWRTIL